MPLIELQDGRSIAYEQSGDPNGVPVLFQHGTGDSRLARHPDEALTTAAGVRLITADRPGVGGSTRVAERTLLDWSADVESLTAHLGIGRFVVVGWSGGGPHALAVAHRLGDRVSGIVLASPLAPLDRPGARDLVLNKDLREIWGLRHAKWVAALAGRIESRSARKDPDAFVAELAKSAPADAPVLTDPGLEPMFAAEMDEALAQHGSGVLDDMWAFLDWGFNPEEVTQPVALFLGDADEILAPDMYRGLAERLPGAGPPREWPGGGHYALFARERWRELMEAAAAFGG
ncbi:MAG: alpha/beta hydrolase [Solirubrobacterales bacterium]|nr:alpha/beta hydrolase [Solirubrobacterales bacterium]MCB8970545.1 alpha/beta hydrolase [Thermoleophilales bacterium]MCO5325705.1 alpha/beta hydrolase [Solirubrobacterales bacterium]